MQLLNPGASQVADITATVTAKTSGVTISAAESSYPNIAPSGSALNIKPFVFYLPTDAQCGQRVDLSLNVTMTVGTGTTTSIYDLSVPTGQPLVGSTITGSYNGPPVPIPDVNAAGVNVPLEVIGVNGVISDLNFRFDGTSCSNAAGSTTVGLDHTWVADLVVKLTSPSGTSVTLIDNVGGSGNNFCNTVLDDEATTSIQTVTATNAPFTGTFKLGGPLSRFDGENPSGVWTLNVSDTVGFDVGNVRAFSLVVSPVQYSCNVAPADTTAPNLTESFFNPGPPPSGDITAQDSQSGLANIRVVATDNVEVQVPSFSPGTTSPVVVTGTLIDPTQNGVFEVEATDVAGNVSLRSRTVQLVPDVIVRDARVAEPNSGTTSMLFAVTLSTPATQPITINFSTANGTAVAPQDYVLVSNGSVTFLAGEQIKLIPTTVNSDVDNTEGDEAFSLTISADPTLANVTDGIATGTITATNSPGTLLVSELRTSGPGGSNDDFVELYNNTDAPVTVSAGGYGLFKTGPTCDATPVLVGTVPAGTIIPARGHYLFVGSAYSLASYATGDATLTSDIEDNGNVAIFSTTNIADLSTVSRFDAIGFGSNIGSVCDLLREGSNQGAITVFTVEHSFFRKLCAHNGSACTTPGIPKDTNNNAADLVFADTAGVSIGAGQLLGAPGPENLASPIKRDSAISLLLLDTSVAAASAPNRVRDLTPGDPNHSTFGTLSVRRRIVNNTGVSVTRLRIRTVEITTFPPPSGSIADLRVITSPTLTGVTVNDATTCTATGTPATSPCTVTVQGTMLEQPPNQLSGGGLNSTLAAGTITLATPLANGASINVNFLLGVQQTGSFRYLVIIEALP